MITEIQRKEVDVIESSLGSYLDISDDDNGMFVLYDDHKVFVAELGKKVTKFESSEGCDSNYQRKRHTELKKVARDLRESNTELEKRVKELEEAQRWRSVDIPESINDFDILYLIEKGTGKKIISKKFEVIFPQSGEPEVIYNIKKNHYFLWCNYLDGSSHISGIYGIKLPAKGGES